MGNVGVHICLVGGWVPSVTYGSRLVSRRAARFEIEYVLVFGCGSVHSIFEFLICRFLIFEILNFFN